MPAAAEPCTTLSAAAAVDVAHAIALAAVTHICARSALPSLSLLAIAVCPHVQEQESPGQQAVRPPSNGKLSSRARVLSSRIKLSSRQTAPHHRAVECRRQPCACIALAVRVTMTVPAKVQDPKLRRGHRTRPVLHLHLVCPSSYRPTSRSMPQRSLLQLSPSQWPPLQPSVQHARCSASH